MNAFSQSDIYSGHISRNCFDPITYKMEDDSDCLSCNGKMEKGQVEKCKSKEGFFFNPPTSPHSKGSLVLRVRPGNTGAPGYLLRVVDAGRGAGEWRGIQLLD